MHKSLPISSVLPTALVLLLLAVAAPAISAGDDDDGERIPFSVATIYLELNDTDGDLGIHALIDGEPWKVMEIENPNERDTLRVTARGSMRRHGMTELFFESAEPGFDELDPADFFRRFPEGEWEISGRTIEGDELESVALLSHVMAAPPENIFVSGVPAAEDCDADPLPAVVEPIVIRWDPVTSSHPEIGRSGPVQVVRYELFVAREEPTPLVFAVQLPPDVTEFEVPEDFIALGDEFKLEILVREATGNQTAIESCFRILEDE